MSDSMYTKESLAELNSSKTGGKYIKTFTPNLIWGLLAVIILVAGALTWGILGNIQNTISAVGIDIRLDSEKKVELYIKEGDISEVKVGQEVIINNNSCKIETLSSYPVQIVEDSDALYGYADDDNWNIYQNYILYYANVESGSWFYVAEATYNYDEVPNYHFFTCQIVTESTTPIAKFFKGVVNKL